MNLHSTGIFPATKIRVRDYIRILDNHYNLVQDGIYWVLEVIPHSYRDVVNVKLEDTWDYEGVTGTIETTFSIDDMIEIMRE